MREKIYKKTDECLKLNDDMLEVKNNLSRELALSNQKNEFYSKRINELQNSMERQQKNNEDKMVSQKEEIIAEQRDTLSRLKGERDQLDGRYDAKKKHLKEMEQEYTLKVSDLEKQVAVLLEKNANITSKKNEFERKLTLDSS